MKRTFRYGNKQGLGLILSTIFATAVGYVLRLAIVRYRPGDGIYIGSVVAVAAFMILFAILVFRDVVVNDIGIARSFFGIRGRTLRWEKIVAVRCGVIDSPTGKVPACSFQAYKRLWPFSFIMIMPSIDGADELIALLDDEVTKRGIPIKGWRGNRLVTIDRLPLPSKGCAKDPR
ncbi:hypothetical protein C8J98_11033 [Luteibacter sp. OK325]|uniref:hypothetical protein n=1 Tax=Luteibacter sp. OK325 TaxID=2135670 RepID=UPI000D3DAC1E|nr:hypothetical protein [Luteibacter sp. OK325]PTR26303.1 hypothetical protein C8J98_11033 [Luteibacter sp. OK325]